MVTRILWPELLLLVKSLSWFWVTTTPCSDKWNFSWQFWDYFTAGSRESHRIFILPLILSYSSLSMRHWSREFGVYTMKRCMGVKLSVLLLLLELGKEPGMTTQLWLLWWRMSRTMGQWCVDNALDVHNRKAFCVFWFVLLCSSKEHHVLVGGAGSRMPGCQGSSPGVSVTDSQDGLWNSVSFWLLAKTDH